MDKRKTERGGKALSLIRKLSLNRRFFTFFCLITN